MHTLASVLFRHGDPRWADLPSEALALLEPLPPGPALVEALTEVARVEMLQGRHDAAISSAERALKLADELGLERPARALGYRGSSRADRGDPLGIQDMREAIPLATLAGRGREVASLHNNLGVALWVFEGPQAALTELAAGVGYATARGLTEIAVWTTAQHPRPALRRRPARRGTRNSRHPRRALRRQPGHRGRGAKRASSHSRAARHTSPGG